VPEGGWLAAWGGPASVLGGLFWIASAVATAIKPGGCLGAECDLPALLLVAFAVQALLFAGDFPYMPLVVIPGALMLLIGILLMAITVLRAGVLARWASVLLIVGTLAMFGYNDQNAQALLAVPFGIAWLGVGDALCSTRGQPASS
jgi:hypothetical protein